MKIYLSANDAVMTAAGLVSADLKIEICECARADISVTVKETDSHTLTVSLNEKNAEITYGGGVATFLRGLAMLVFAVRRGETKKQVTENAIFHLNGAMVDMSRNAVMKVETVKFMMRKMALMGQNAFMLYTEDTYEIEGRPYFGYMRGRYTKDELRELDRYALSLGIELIPCIQTLGHLATMLKWTCTGKFKDTDRVLLVGAEETYALIDDMFDTVAECFTTKRLHVGMDETIGLGTGAYLTKNGYRIPKDIFIEHLARVTEMATSRGFKPMMWSDMIIEMGGGSRRVYDPNAVITDEFAEAVPSEMQMVFWDYYNAAESFYTKNIVNHKKLGTGNTMFGGGIWTWSSHCPLFSRSLDFTLPALDACKKEGVTEVIATIWHNGSEASLITALAGLAWYADYGYKGEYREDSVKECFAFGCGEDYDSFMALQDPDRPDGGKLSLSRSFLYNDPLVGLVDAHLKGLNFDEYYKETAARLAAITPKNALFAPSFDIAAKLSSLLEVKACFGVKAIEAYKNGDRTTLAALAGECDVMAERLEALRVSHRAAWMKYNKPFGFEVLDLRYGGIRARIDTAKYRIEAYLRGEIERIEELEADRLRFDCSKEHEAPFTNAFLWRSFQGFATPNIL